MVMTNHMTTKGCCADDDGPFQNLQKYLYPVGFLTKSLYAFLAF